MRRKKMTAREKWHEKYFEEYSDIIMVNCIDDEKRMRLLKKLISWQSNFDTELVSKQ